MSSETGKQLYAVLIALVGDTLLLPNVAIAEVVARDAVQHDPRLPPWLAGFVEWNSRRLPVLHFEALNGGALPAGSRRERVVVVNSNGRHLPSGQFALVTQTYPHLVTLTRVAVQPEPLREGDRSDLILSRARVANQIAVIPDLDMIEAEIARALSPSSEPVAG